MCAISDQIGKGDLDIHHSKPFNVIRDEILKELNLDIRKSIGEYSSNELSNLTKRFLEEHLKYDGVLIREDLHLLFHYLYGWDENVCMNNLREFKVRFNNGEFEYLKDNNNKYVLPSSLFKEEFHVHDFMS
jgi:hypothetical protein